MRKKRVLSVALVTLSLLVSGGAMACKKKNSASFTYMGLKGCSPSCSKDKVSIRDSQAVEVKVWWPWNRVNNPNATLSHNHIGKKISMGRICRRDSINAQATYRGLNRTLNSRSYVQTTGVTRVSKAGNKTAGHYSCYLHVDAYKPYGARDYRARLEDDANPRLVCTVK